MSLINKMLADLEDRQAYLVDEKDVALDGVISVSDEYFDKKYPSKKSYIGSGIVLLSLAVFMLVYFYNNYSSYIWSSSSTGSVLSNHDDSSATSTLSPDGTNLPVAKTATSNSNHVSLKIDTVLSEEPRILPLQGVQLGANEIVAQPDNRQVDLSIEPQISVVPENMPEVISEKENPDTVQKQKIGTLSLNRIPTTVDDHLREGIAHYKRGEVGKSLNLLIKVLQQYPEHIKARSTLATFLVEQRDYPSAQSVLKEGVALFPEQYDWVRLIAQLYVTQGKTGEALKILLGTKPAIEDNPEYYAFLAGLLQQQGNHKEALEYYKGLVQIRDDNGLWWTGLGISFEKTGQLKQSSQAYNMALRDASLSTDLKKYVNQRLYHVSGK